MAILLRQGAEQPALGGENRLTSDNYESRPLAAELGVSGMAAEHPMDAIGSEGEMKP